VVLLILAANEAARQESEKINARLKAYDQERARRDLEVRRLHSPEDAVKRADKMIADNQPRHLMNLIEDLRERKPKVLEGITPAHVAWVAETFAKEGQNPNLIDFVRQTITDKRLRSGLTSAAINQALEKMSIIPSAWLLYNLSADPNLAAAVLPKHVEKIAKILAYDAAGSDFIILLQAAERVPAWQPLIRKGAAYFHVDYAFRPADETGEGNAILVMQKFGRAARLNVMHSTGYRSYWWSMKPQKPINLLVDPLSRKKSQAEINALRQGVTSKYRSAMQELADRHPRNARLRGQLTKLDERITKMGLAVA